MFRSYGDVSMLRNQVLLAISLIMVLSVLIITAYLVVDKSSSGVEVNIKFKILHGRIVDDSREVEGAYYIFLNMHSFREDFAPWLVYMALTKDYSWWKKEFSEKVAKAAQYVKKMFQEYCTPPLRPETISQYSKEIAATVYEWWFANLWEKVIGSCIPPFYIEVMIGNDIYSVFYTISSRCIEQYDKVLRLGGRFNLTVIWVSDELKPVQGDFKTVLGWSSICTLDSGFIKKLLKVIELSDLWNETWSSIQSYQHASM